MCIRDVYVKPIVGDSPSPILFYTAKITDKKLLLVNGLKLDAMVAVYPENPLIPLTTRFWLDLLEQAKSNDIINVCCILPCKSAIEESFSLIELKPSRIKEFRDDLCYNWYCFRKNIHGTCYCELHQDEIEYEKIFGGEF